MTRLALHILTRWLPWQLGIVPAPTGKPAAIHFPTHTHIAAGDSGSALSPSESAPARPTPRLRRGLSSFEGAS